MLRVKANGQEFEIDPSKFTFGEGRAIEKVTGEPFGSFGPALQAGSLTAVQSLVWVAAKRKDPTLKFSDLDEWDLGDLDIEDDDAPEEGAEADPTPAADEAA